MVVETSFASGSLDGSVVVWHVDTLAPLKVLDYPEHYYENHIFTSSINHITVFSEVCPKQSWKYCSPLWRLPKGCPGQRYLGAAVGRGFKVYDINTGECVAHCKDAHDANVTRILCMYERYCSLFPIPFIHRVGLLQLHHVKNTDRFMFS